MGLEHGFTCPNKNIRLGPHALKGMKPPYNSRTKTFSAHSLVIWHRNLSSTPALVRESDLGGTQAYQQYSWRLKVLFSYVLSEFVSLRGKLKNHVHAHKNHVHAYLKK